MKDLGSRGARASFPVAALAACLLPAVPIIAWGLESPLSVQYLCWAVVAALTPTLLFGRSRGPVDPFSPYLGLSVLLTLYSLSTIQFVEQNGVSFYFESVAPGDLTMFAVACVLGQVGLGVGMAAAAPRGGPSPVRQAQASEPALQALTSTALLLSVLMLPFYFDRLNFTNVVSYAEAAFEVRLDRMQDPQAGLREVFLSNLPAGLLLCACTALMLDRRRVWAVRAAAAAVLLAYMATSLLSGWRGQLVAAALLPLMAYHYHIRRFSTSMMIAGSVAAYTLINALSIMRLSANLSEMWELLTEDTADRGLAFLQFSQSGELATSTNLLRLMIGIDRGESDFKWGGLWLSQIASAVPRAIWPDRPPLGNELFVQVFYPGVYEAGGGFGFFILQDGYWDFGLPGIVLYMAALAYVMQRLHRALIVDRSGMFWTLCYAILYGQLVLSSVRSGLGVSVKEALMQIFPLVLVWLLAGRRQLPSNHRNAVG